MIRRSTWLLLGLAVGACSSSSSPPAAAPCSDNPVACGKGTTCWPSDSAFDLKCLPSQPGVSFGASCEENIGAPTCGDGMLCDQRGAEGGSCTSYCDTGHPCPQGFSCRKTQVGQSGPGIDICRAGGDDGGVGPGNDGGGDDGGLIIPDTGAGDAVMM